MKILVSTFTYFPNTDGVAEASTVLVKGLAARGHVVTVATAYHPERKPNAPGDNPQIEQFKLFGSDLGDGPDEERQRYERFVRNFACDVMLFECWDTWSTRLARPLLGGIEAKKVLISHGYAAHQWTPYPKFAWGLGAWLKRLPQVVAMPLYLRRYDHVVFLSHRAAWDRFLDHWVAQVTNFRRFSIIPNGAFREEFSEQTLDFRSHHAIGPGPMLLCVANYCDRKNQKMALRAFLQAASQGATLVFIGSEFNEYSRELIQLNEMLKLKFPAGRVILLEKVPRPMTCAAYRAADLFILSAKAETQPIVLFEAMASHTPFISTDTGCVAELPGGIVARSEEELGSQMRKLIDAPDARKKLAEEGWNACKSTYDWERVIESYDTLLSRLAGTAKRNETPCAVTAK